MELNNSDVQNSLKACFDELYFQYSNNSKYKVLLHYLGELSQGTSYALTNKIEKIIGAEGDSKGIVKRIFSIFVESLQNIRGHSPKDSDGNQFTFFIIAQSSSQYECLIGNIVLDEAKDFLTKRIEEINKLEKVELKNLYLETMTNGVISDKGGAGLGIITIGMKSGNKIDHHYYPLKNGSSIYTIMFKIDRIKAA